MPGALTLFRPGDKMVDCLLVKECIKYFLAAVLRFDIITGRFQINGKLCGGGGRSYGTALLQKLKVE